MDPKPHSKSGEYWREHVLSWEASAYYKDSRQRPSFWDWLSILLRGQGMYLRMQAALELVRPHIRDCTVLDIGCASGRFAVQLLEAGAGRVIGIDVAPQAIEAAEQRRQAGPYAERMEFKVMDVTQPEAELPAVDLITALGVIEYFDAATLSALLGRFRTRHFLLDFPDAEARRRDWWMWSLRRVYLRLNRCPGVYLYTQDEFRRLAAEHGFTDVRYVRRFTFDFATNLPSV